MQIFYDEGRERLGKRRGEAENLLQRIIVLFYFASKMLSAFWSTNIS